MAAPAPTRFSRFAGGLRVGADFFEREGALTAALPSPRGLVDRMEDLAHPGVDVTRVHPAIVTFFEDTAALELHIKSRWRFPFSLGWRFMLRPILRWIGQFTLPVTEGRIATRVLGLDRERDGRRDPRGVIREYTDTADAGRVMQVVAYATWEQAGGARIMSCTFPVPGGHVAGFLRLDPIGADDEGRIAVELTSRRHHDTAGIWFVIRAVALRLPLGERLQLWAAGMANAPHDIDQARLPGATIVGRHEQRFFGVRVVTHDYLFRPVEWTP
jgi:hypothetical protein